MKAEEFNKLMAELEGIDVSECKLIEGSLHHDTKHFYYVYNWYEDLNLLMPLAWKYGIYVTEMCGEFTGHYYPVNVKKRYTSKDKDPIQAIRDCLTAIAKDKDYE